MCLSVKEQFIQHSKSFYHSYTLVRLKVFKQFLVTENTDDDGDDDAMR